MKFTKNEVLPYLLGEIGYESFIEDGDMLLAYIQEKDFNEQSLRSLLESSGEMCANVDYIWSKVEDKDWNEEWEKEGFEPIVVADCLKLKKVDSQTRVNNVHLSNREEA